MTIATYSPPGTDLEVRERELEPAVWPEAGETDTSSALDWLLYEADVAEGKFIYGPVATSKDLHLPELDPSRPDRSKSAVSATEFYLQARDMGFIDQALDLFRDVHSFTVRPDGEARPILIEAPVEEWEREDGLSQLMPLVLDLYNVRDHEQILREDQDFQGTKVYMAYSGEPFLLVESSFLWTEDGRTEVYRCLEAADASTPTAILNVLNELSLGEKVRIQKLLDDWQVHGTHALERANRQTVQSDADIRTLLSRRHGAIETGWRNSRIYDLAARLVDRVVTPPDWFVRLRRPRRLSQDNTTAPSHSTSRT